MNQDERLPRSSQLLDRKDSALLVVDVQTKLLNLIPGHDRIAWNVGRLIDGARFLNIPVVATEQHPRALGPTDSAVLAKLHEAEAPVLAKIAFSCAETGRVFRDFSARGIYKILLVGIEAHVCVFQTAMDLMAEGFDVYLAVDAIGARFDVDRDIAFRRLDSAGAALATTEMALFEWCDIAGTPDFRRIRSLILQPEPVRPA
jgi:nicotinamidase-related amidase